MTLQKAEQSLRGKIFDIQGLSIHDGPGCRTTVFLSGCSLNCIWCSNPEGISKKSVPLYFETNCILCFKCIENCPERAIIKENGSLIFGRDKCIECDDHTCINNCYTDALKISAYEISVLQLLKIIQRDRQFWGSRGGLTLSGGEPLLQITFSKQILKKCYESYIHTAVETCGNIPYKYFNEILPYTEWIFFDLKQMNSYKHMQGTGAKNTLIIQNAKRLSKEFKGRLIFRYPYIPGFNDSENNTLSVISFLKGIGKDEINILPIHHLGREKYHLLGKEYNGLKYPIPKKHDLDDLKRIFINNGIHCYIGSETPF